MSKKIMIEKVEFNLPPGTSDSDDYFDLPSANGANKGRRTSVPPKTTMVYCPQCCLHYKAPAEKEYWKARVEVCETCEKKSVGELVGVADEK